MKALNITLVFNGRAEAALAFYKSIFGGEYLSFQRMKEIPEATEMPAEAGEMILHGSIPLAGGVLAAMDMPPGRGELNEGNNFMITLDTESEEETTLLFNKLAEGGTVMMPLANQFWGAFFGMITDQFGLQWMLSYRKA